MINDTKGYKTLIYKQRENIRDEKKELFLFLYRYRIFKFRTGKKVPNTNELKQDIRNEITMIIKINLKSKFLQDKQDKLGISRETKT